MSNATSNHGSSMTSSLAVSCDDVDPSEVWRDAIANNEDVCKRCYLRIKRTIPYPWKQGHRFKHQKQILAYVKRNVPADAEYDIAESFFTTQEDVPNRIGKGDPGDKLIPCSSCNGTGEQQREVTVDDRVVTQHRDCNDCNGTGTQWKHGHGSYCLNCGEFEHHKPAPPRPIEDIKDVAFNVSMTLTELDIPHNFVVLVERVQELKRTELSGNDFQCFKRAVRDAVRDARHTGANQ